VIFSRRRSFALVVFIERDGGGLTARHVVIMKRTDLELSFAAARRSNKLGRILTITVIRYGPGERQASERGAFT
jgi:hypothetical protein